MRTCASAHHVQTYSMRTTLFSTPNCSRQVFCLGTNNRRFGMKTCYTQFSLFIFMWMDMLLNHVSAIGISNPSLNIDSSYADSPNASDFDRPIATLTSLGAIDPAFSFVPVFQGAKLRPVPCLLNSVNVALQLALEDFEGPMFETVFRLDSHPQVEIAVIPDEEGGCIPRKYAVWGLNIGIGTSFQTLPIFFGTSSCSARELVFYRAQC